MPHYFSENQSSPLNLKKINDNLRGIDFEFFTGSGVFSGKKIDNGSKLLIESIIIKKDWKILDLGCGYGPVGVVIAKIFPQTEITMSDVNKRAVSLAKRNIEHYKLKNANAICSNVYEKIKDKYDSIIVNPPQTAGKKVCFEIIEKSIDFLNKDGVFQIVARHKKGGIELSKKMKEVYGNVKDIAKKGGYRVYISKN